MRVQREKDDEGEQTEWLQRKSMRVKMDEIIRGTKVRRRDYRGWKGVERKRRREG